MRKFKALLEESKNLEVFEVIRLMNEFISGKGVTASVQKLDNCFNIYISGYANDEAKKELSGPAVLKHFKSLGVAEEADIVKTQYGFKIVMGPDCQDAKLMEAYAKETEELFECCICEEVFHGAGKNPWPISDSIDDRVCESCNKKHVVPSRLNEIRESRRINEALGEDEVKSIEHEASNTVLDKRFIWVFAVLNERGEYIDENIAYLQDAIEVLLNNDATFLIAFPYVDPKPSDENVGLVFADNPGPITLYNREEVTLPKSALAPTEKEIEPEEGHYDNYEPDTAEESVKNEGKEVITEWLNGMMTQGHLDKEFFDTNLDISKEYIVSRGILEFYEYSEDYGIELEEPYTESELLEWSRDEIVEYYLALQEERDQSRSHRESMGTSIQIRFNEEAFKADEALYEMFSGDFEGYMTGITEASVELAEIKPDKFQWKINKGVMESQPMPLEEAKELLNRLKRDFQVEAELNFSSPITESDDSEDYYLIANFKDVFYESVGEEVDVMEVYKSYLDEVKAKSEDLKPNFYYEGSISADYYSNLMTEAEAKQVAALFDTDRVEVQIKKVEVK
jgi:hypothetical protein